MSQELLPNSRVFRIGRECYVIYLGNNKDDIRPFLRIGNKKNIPGEIHDWVSTTVITDNHLGNPLIETLDAQRFHGRYLGDTEIAVAIRQFFKSFDLPVDEITDYKTMEEGEGRHMVWFYSSGNIHLRYDESVIFDLEKRQKEDGHYLQLFELAKGYFQRNTLRYIRQDFSGRGIVFSRKDVFWYENGELVLFGPQSGFVTELMNQGVDPDFVGGLAYNLSAQDIGSSEAAAYISFVKRKRHQKGKLLIVTEEEEVQRKLRLLFPKRDDVPCSIEIGNLSDGKKTTFKNSTIQTEGNIWKIKPSGLPQIVLGGDVDANGISINPDKNSIHFASQGVEFNVPSGFPIEFRDSSAPMGQIVEKYIGKSYSNIKDQLPLACKKMLVAYEKCLRFLEGMVHRGEVRNIQGLKQSASLAYDELSSCSSRESGIVWFFISNIRSLALSIVSNLEESDPIRKIAETLALKVDVFLNRMPAPAPSLPFFGDCFIDKKRPFLFWRASKRSFVPGDLVMAKNLSEKINEVVKQDTVEWKENQDRLLKLIRSLGRGGKGPISPDQSALLKNAQRKTKLRPSQKKALASETVKPTPTPPKKQKTMPVKSDLLLRMGSSGSRRRPAMRRVSLWWLWLLLLLLLGGAVAWVLSGKAPWGSSVLYPLPGIDSDRAGNDLEDGSTLADEASVSTDGSTKKTDGVSGTVDDDSVVVNGSAADAAGIAEIDPDAAPSTIGEVQAYLDVSGRVNITEIDIHLASNGIAVLNGYRDLDYEIFTGNDPNWIYPGNNLRLSDTENYIISSGDTIWFLAARKVRLSVQKELAVYDEAIKILNNDGSSDKQRSDAKAVLQKIATSSFSSEMRKMTADTLK